jgi:hypothetical protein
MVEFDTRSAGHERANSPLSLFFDFSFCFVAFVG